jgi:hypothetical protein
LLPVTCLSGLRRFRPLLRPVHLHPPTDGTTGCGAHTTSPADHRRSRSRSAGLRDCLANRGELTVNPVFLRFQVAERTAKYLAQVQGHSASLVVSWGQEPNFRITPGEAVTGCENSANCESQLKVRRVSRKGTAARNLPTLGGERRRWAHRHGNFLERFRGLKTRRRDVCQATIRRWGLDASHSKLTANRSTRLRELSRPD